MSRRKKRWLEPQQPELKLGLPPLPTMDPIAGAKAKMNGMELVLGHNQVWKEMVAPFVFKLVGKFSCDNVRMACAEAGVPDPKHPNAWGALISALAKCGAIRRVAFTHSWNPSRHRAVVGVWEINLDLQKSSRESKGKLEQLPPTERKRKRKV